MHTRVLLFIFLIYQSMKKLLISLSLICSLQVGAQVKLCPVFSSNMVMQQKTDNAPIWGEAKPGKKISITTSWDNQTVTCMADAEGKWKTAVKTPSAGGPYTITIAEGKKKTVLENVLIGEVWVCSGQSNMEMPIEGWGRVMNFEQEKVEANNYPNIRFLSAKHVTSATPLTDLAVENDGWEVCNSESVREFSSTAYFFGRNLHQTMNIPIGLIDTSWGGTLIEAWTSLDALSTLPDQAENVRRVREIPASAEEAAVKYEKDMAEWSAMTMQRDRGFENGKPVYALPSTDVSYWKDLKLPGDVDKYNTELASMDGFWWARTTIDIPASMAGKDLQLQLGRIDDNDITYFNGTEIGSSAGFLLPRIYTIPANLVKEGKNTLAVRIHDTGGGTGITIDNNGFKLIDPQSNTEMALPEDWKYSVSLTYGGNLPMPPANLQGNPNVHSVLFNAMLNPIIPYTIKGAIWYQGESNAGEAYQYRDLMPLMIKDWRNRWGYEFPFYMVQLANYMQRQPEPKESSWAELREAQLLTAQHLENTGMATIIDIGEANDIHPKNKQEVGRRLALLARANTYGEKVVCMGPQYRDYRIENGKLRIMFNRWTSNGMKTSDGQKVKGFAIAGMDRKWHWADAVIENGTVVLSSPDVPFPVAARYAWGDNPECNLVGETGLPASPFRTDDWQGITYGKKR